MSVAFEGPVLIAIYGFTLILVLAVVGDSRVVVAGGQPWGALHMAIRYHAVHLCASVLCARISDQGVGSGYAFDDCFILRARRSAVCRACSVGACGHLY